VLLGALESLPSQSSSSYSNISETLPSQNPIRLLLKTISALLDAIAIAQRSISMFPETDGKLEFPREGYKAGASYLEKPNTGSKYPNTRSEYPNTRSEYLNTRSEYPNTRSECPNTRSECPNTRSECPNTRSECPNTGSECPNTRSEYPNTRSKYPNTTVKNSRITSNFLYFKI